MKELRTLIFILIIVAVAIWMVIPNNPGIHLLGIDKEIRTVLGLDLVGGVQVLLEADLPEGTAIDPAAMDTAAKIVDNRVNGLGVEEAVVQQAGERFIVVEIPDVQDPEQAIATVQETALLEFVDMSSISQQQAVTLEGTRIQTDYQTGVVTDTQSLTQTVWHTIMTGADISTVGVTTDQLGQPVVGFELTSNGAQIFRVFTSQHIGDVLAIVLDKEVISVPSINDAITDGKGIIQGNFTTETANQMAVQLRYGSLPIPLKVAETRTIGPTLGKDSLNKSLLAGVIGFSIVVLFMGLYYRLPGVVAILAILIYATVTFALFRYLPVTLTLPGIAGLMLSTGSALDANILVFERLKEELRSGRTLAQAIELGWQRAWPSIRDSNLATVFTCLILYYFGSAFGATIVKGFSITLLLGVVVSLFTAIIVTRTFLRLVTRWLHPSNLAVWFGI